MADQTVNQNATPGVTNTSPAQFNSVIMDPSASRTTTLVIQIPDPHTPIQEQLSSMASALNQVIQHMRTLSHPVSNPVASIPPQTNHPTNQVLPTVHVETAQALAPPIPPSNMNLGPNPWCNPTFTHGHHPLPTIAFQDDPSAPLQEKAKNAQVMVTSHVPINANVDPEPSHPVVEKSPVIEDVRGMARRIKKLSKRIRVMSEDATKEESLLKDLPVCMTKPYPEKLKIPGFTKYDGTGCPHTHVQQYNREMGPYSRDNCLMISMFHNSLSGGALAWFAKYDKKKIQTWDGLIRIFLNRFKDLRGMLNVLKRKLNKTREELITDAYKGKGEILQSKPSPLEINQPNQTVTLIPIKPSKQLTNKPARSQGRLTTIPATQPKNLKPLLKHKLIQPFLPKSSPNPLTIVNRLDQVRLHESHHDLDTVNVTGQKPTKKAKTHHTINLTSISAIRTPTSPKKTHPLRQNDKAPSVPSKWVEPLSIPHQTLEAVDYSHWVEKPLKVEARYAKECYDWICKSGKY